jgi:hypothetical protein
MSQANNPDAAVSTERVAAKMRPLRATANEQVLDRLQALLASEGS